MTILTATVAGADAGRKLKYYVRSVLGVSNGQLSGVKAQGGLYVNDAPALANAVLREGDRVEVRLEEKEQLPPRAIPEAGEVHIVYMDDQLLIIDKPAPLACQASDRRPIGTLENRLSYRFRDDVHFVFRPLNRLDKGTSGLMCAARTPFAAQRLQRLLHTPDFVREYLAVAEGMVSGSGVWDGPIAKADEASVRRVIDVERGKSACTHWQAEAHGNGRTLLRLRLETGRTHQIRVHASAAGLPLCGDFLYGTETEELPGRFALHSAYLSLIHPVTGERMEWSSPLPEALAGLLEERNAD